MSSAQPAELEARAIAAAKAVSARTLDVTLPDVPFESWFRAEVRPETTATWEASDCGESTGNPAVDAGRDQPLCVDASATSPEGVVVTVQVLVGTWGLGVTGTPRVFWAYDREGDRLGELPALGDLRPRLDLSRVTRGPDRLRFAATSIRPEIRQSLSRDLEFVVRREVDASGHHMGWQLSVIDCRLRASPNFLEEELWGHGPRLHDLHAWHVAEDYFPLDRRLPVYGYPVEVRAVCQECQISTSSGKPAFTFGWVEISWRRLAVPNPRQRRLK